MRDSASRRTMASSKTPQARPTPLVQVICAPLTTLAGPLSFASGRSRRLLSILRHRRDRAWSRASGFPFRGCRPESRPWRCRQLSCSAERARSAKLVEILPLATSDCFAGHQIVLHFFILGAVEDRHRRTQADLVLGDIVHVDQRQVGQALAELANARLQVLLALLGRVILGVFAEIAEGDGLLEFSGDIEGQLVLERVQFVAKLFLDALQSSPLGIIARAALGWRHAVPVHRRQVNSGI